MNFLLKKKKLKIKLFHSRLNELIVSLSEILKDGQNKVDPHMRLMLIDFRGFILLTSLWQMNGKFFKINLFLMKFFFQVH